MIAAVDASINGGHMLLDIRAVKGRHLLPEDGENNYEIIADGHGSAEGVEISRSIADRLLVEPTDAVLLAALISSVSEDGWCATWLMGIEHEAWAGLPHGLGPTCCLDDADRAVVRTALAAARKAMGGAWVAWLDETQAPPGEEGVYALDRDAWAALAWEKMKANLA